MPNSSVNKGTAHDAQGPPAWANSWRQDYVSALQALPPSAPRQDAHPHPCCHLPQAWPGSSWGFWDVRRSSCQLLECENSGNLPALMDRFQSLFLKMAVNRVFSPHHIHACFIRGQRHRCSLFYDLKWFHQSKQTMMAWKRPKIKEIRRESMTLGLSSLSAVLSSWSRYCRERHKIWNEGGNQEQAYSSFTNGHPAYVHVRYQSIPFLWRDSKAHCIVDGADSGTILGGQTKAAGQRDRHQPQLTPWAGHPAPLGLWNLTCKIMVTAQRWRAGQDDLLVFWGMLILSSNRASFKMFLCNYSLMTHSRVYGDCRSLLNSAQSGCQLGEVGCAQFS